MRPTSPGIPLRYYARLAAILQREGIDPARLARRARLRLDAGPDALIRLPQVELLLAAVTRATPRTDLAFELGRAVKLSSHSIVGYGILSSPDLEYALRLAARYFRLIMPTFRMRYARDARHLQVVFEPAAPQSAACLSFHLEAIAVATHFEIRELLQNRMPAYELQLSYPEPPHAARYAELEEARCRFGWDAAPGVRMHFPAAVAGRALALADPGALQMAEARCRELVRNVTGAGRTGDWVRMMLREASGGLPTLAELARTLNLSARTLDRHLQREGAGFRELARRARHERACALLARPELSVTQVAHELGYTDAANFTRAFRREAGHAPTAYRARHIPGHIR